MGLPAMLAERYDLVGAIGRGRSLVYEARDRRLGNRRCAIKILDLHHESREKIAHEIDILARHAPQLFFIPDVYDTGSDHDLAYIVMEYIEGSPLAPPWEPLRVEQFVRTILTYLIRLHAAGIVHRDLKPQNIMSTANPERPYVLIDFGIAKHGAETLNDARMQLSLDYAPPEQFTATTDARSDLFSLGATAYALLVGEPPANAMERQQADTFVPPGQRVPHVSPALDTVITEMLRLRPDQRPPNAEAALAILDGRSGETTLADQQLSRPLDDRAGAAWLRQPHWRLALLVVAALIFFAGVSMLRVGWGAAPDPTQSATAPPIAVGIGSDTPTGPTVPAETVALNTPTPIGSPTPTPVPVISMCREAGRKELGGFDFLRDQGVVMYNHATTAGAVLNDKVRVIKTYANGLLIGYHATANNPANGLSYLSVTTMMDCNTADGIGGQNVNAIAVDPADRIWVGGEHGGLVLFDQLNMRRYSDKDVLPSDEIFGLTAQGDRVWISTINGVATVDHAETWDIPYQAGQNLGIAFNDVHAVAVDSAGWVWVGHINNGISLLRTGQPWRNYPTEAQEFSGRQVRDILVLKRNGQEQVWIATADGGVILYQNDTWTTYDTTSGLPSNTVWDIAVDSYQRLWLATAKGVVYFDGTNWLPYHSLPTYSIDFGTAANPVCSGCRFTADRVWTGTDGYGLTFSGLPYPDQAFDVARVCFWRTDQPQVCPPFTQSPLNITATYTDTVLEPDERLNFSVEITPRGGYDLSQTRGDMLLNTDPGNRILFGVHDNIGVKGEVAPGERHTFVDTNKPIVATDLDACQPDGAELVCTSSWRLWTRTRHAGPAIRLVFRVRAPVAPPTGS